MIPPIIPLTGDTPRLHQHVSRSHVARRHANALPTQATQIPMALRRHERNFATQSVHTLEANISHDTANHPAHQRHAAFTPCFALPCGTAPLKHASHQGRANPMALRHHERNFAIWSAHTLEANMIPPIIPLTSDTPCLQQRVSRSPVARRRANAVPTKATQLPLALRHHERNFATRSAHTLQAFRTRRPPKSRFESARRAIRTRLPPKITRQVSKTSVSYETSSKSHTSSLQNERLVRDSSKSHTSSLQNERFVRDVLKNSHVKVCKTSVSDETSSKSQAETPIGAHTNTHHTPLPSSFAIPAPPSNTRSHASSVLVYFELSSQKAREKLVRIQSSI